MNLWVLDTDMLTLWLRGHDTIAARIAATPPQQLATTIITVEELLRGWYTQVRRARTDAQLLGPIKLCQKQ
jgi:tRNA(fMet)-specific endonuclease VapC